MTSKGGVKMWNGIISEFEEYLPVTDATPRLTLFEGNTPLIDAQALSNKIGADVYVKVEGANPSGSFKDRGMSFALAKAIEEGVEIAMCASTGNTSASLAAYAARANVKAALIIPAGKIAMGKLAQALIHGVQVFAIDGNFDDALRIVRQLGDAGKVTVVNSINPYRIQGQKTAAFEIVNRLGDAPDYHCIPVGNAGNITAYWAGYKQFNELGKNKTLPRMFGFQASGSNPFITGEFVDHPDTIATAIAIGHPASWDLAWKVKEESTGGFWDVTDGEVLKAYSFLAQNQGIFVEPSSATSIAGLFKAAEMGLIGKGSRVVCTVTGNGLKDADRAIKVSTESQGEIQTIPADYNLIFDQLTG